MLEDDQPEPAGEEDAQNSATPSAVPAGANSPPLQNDTGADPRDVRTNIGASTGAVPSSYGAAGGLEDVDDAGP